MAKLKLGEDEELDKKRRTIMNSEKVAEALNNVSNNLEPEENEKDKQTITTLEKIDTVHAI